MTLLKVRCVNNGAPFEVTSDDITLGAMKLLLKSEAAAKKEWANAENGEVLALMDSLLPVMKKVASRHDATWKTRTLEDFEDSLTLQEMRVFMEAVAAAMPEAVQAQDATVPLA